MSIQIPLVVAQAMVHGRGRGGCINVTFIFLIFTHTQHTHTHTRTHTAPTERLAEVLIKTAAEARALVSKVGVRV